MDEQGKVADTEVAPVVDTAAPEETPAETAQPSPDNERVTKLEGTIATLQSELTTVRAEARDSGRRAQSAADSHASRLERRIERLTETLDAVATRGMDENEIRSWKLQRDNERLRESSTERDQSANRQQQEAEFQTYSATVLGEEGIDSKDSVFTEAWSKYSSQAKDPSDWKAALHRAISEVRKAAAKTADEKVKSVEAQAREDERNKIKNENRTRSGPTDQGVAASVTRKAYLDMSDDEFEADSVKKKAERDRRLMRVGR